MRKLLLKMAKYIYSKYGVVVEFDDIFSFHGDMYKVVSTVRRKDYGCVDELIIKAYATGQEGGNNDML